MVHWESDKFIVVMKFRNGNGAKGLTRRPLEEETSTAHRSGLRCSHNLNQ